MKVCNVLNCSFPEWYCNFKGITTESIIIPLPGTFLNYLHTDGVVLPESSNHGIYTKTKKMAMDGDEDDEDIRDDELMKKYEADWATDYSSKTAMSPDFGEFDIKVKSAIKSLGGKVFPKLNWSSPKDAHWIAFDKSLMCTCPSDVYLLLKSSQFIAHDLDQPFLMCEDYTPNTHDSSLNFYLILRKWEPPDPSTEFRCFVHENKLIGVCQRNANKFYPHILNDKKSIVEDISTFLNQSLTVFPDSNYVFDIAYKKKGCVYLIDFNPYGVVTDALMFTWDELNQMADNKRESPVFRCVESEAGVQCLDYANYSIPQDIQHLTTGEDSYKLMDLMKLQIQKEFDSSSSSDENEEASNQIKDSFQNDSR
ncbi:cell division cycle protein 123 homolog [Physella acuta]|uniref:cell division cycle protein 123 homolog n=1 Tax=Physella acuta TaxID=109671 RepID=UPI0027DC45EA|nr:cell division cycle protein 123 homolog [Physella acuta]XP_059152681.1 cell division cycle protein 123 homolog [Physella acuta]